MRGRPPAQGTDAKRRASGHCQICEDQGVSSLRFPKHEEASAHIQNRTSGTNEEMTKPKSIMVSRKVTYVIISTTTRDARDGFALVARANHRCCAFFAIPSSSDCSEAATDPQGYSAPTPIPRRKLYPRRRGISFRERDDVIGGHTDMHRA